MKYLLTKIMPVALLLFAFATPMVSVPVYADAGDDICAGLADTAGSPCATGGTADNEVNSTIQLVINIFSWVVGIAAVIMVIIGGFRYVLSQGESANTAGAKNTIIYALVGLVIVALAQILVKFVLDKAT